MVTFVVGSDEPGISATRLGSQGGQDLKFNSDGDFHCNGNHLNSALSVGEYECKIN